MTLKRNNMWDRAQVRTCSSDAFVVAQFLTRSSEIGADVIAFSLQEEATVI